MGSDGVDAEVEALRRRCEELERGAAAARSAAEALGGVPGVLFQAYARPNGEHGLYYISDRATELLGLHGRVDTALSEIVGRTDERDREKFLASIRAATPDAPWTCEWRYRKPTGETIWLQGSAVPRRRGDELVLDGIFLETTDRKRAEERTAHLTLVLRAIRNVDKLITKEKHRDRLIEGACRNLIQTRGFYGAWIALLDTAGECVAVADAGFEDNSLSFLHHVRRGFLPTCGRRALAQTGPVAQLGSVEACRGCPLLSACSGRAGLACRLEHEGQVSGVICASVPAPYATDPEELTLFEEVAGDVAFALHSLRVEEARHLAQDRLGRLAGAVGYELRNPLGAIKNGAYFLKLALESPEPQVQETLAILDREVSAAECIISSLLAFAQPRQPNPRRTEIVAVVEEALRRCSVPEEIEVSVQLEPMLPTILLDPEQVALALVNIIANAVQAMPGGGRLGISSREERGDLVVSVEDTGPGIPAEALDRIFEPLFTTKARGIGLGLAIVEALVKGNGGAIDVQTASGVGSTFSVRFPCTSSGVVRAIGTLKS